VVFFFFELMIQNIISYHPTGTVTAINTIVQLIILSIWVGGFDLLDSLSLLLFYPLLVSF